jgi:LPS O-antigen subunit length determinant protein (WzzB/FepE family)
LRDNCFRFMKENTFNNLREDEIDLVQLIKVTVSVLKRYYWIIIISVLIGCAGGIWYSITKRPVYTTRFIATSSFLSSSEINMIISALQSLHRKSDYNALAEKLKIDKKALTQIYDFEAKSIRSLDNTSDNSRNNFSVEATVYDPSVLPILQSAFIQYLKDNEFVRKRMILREENLKALTTKISSEITDLDTVKASIKTILKNRNGSSANFMTDPSSVNLQIIALYERILSLEGEIKLNDDIHIIEGFTVSNVPEYQSKSIYIMFGAFIGFLVACLIIALIQQLSIKHNQVA